MGIAIRKAVHTDAPGACALLRRSIEVGCAPDHQGQPDLLDSWLGNKTPHTVANWFATPSHYALVAERDNVLVGLSLLTQAGKISLCYVLPEALRSGVGRALLAATEAQARSWNISKLHLHSPVSASGFFARLGYTNAGKDKACYGLECHLLWKRLDVVPGTAGASIRERFCRCSGQ
jgi:GNAT superfamily N-acetyltransferase